MFTYHCLNNISDTGLRHFGDAYQQVDTSDADAILVRSANMKEMDLSPNIKAVARAGAGVNNIPLDACSEKGIVVFNTPGANANGVKELVIAGMLLASRDIVGGIEWLEKQETTEDLPKVVEKQKKQFAGNEISGKKLGIIGLGAIGVMVANAAANLGMEVFGYDPFISVQAAWSLSRHIHHVTNLDEIYTKCHYITVHVPLSKETTGMIDGEAISKMKDGVVILNFARDGLVNEDAIVEALESGKVKKYVTDFVTPRVAKTKNTLVTPHLGASTAESEENCAEMAVKELVNYLQNGNIKNSVNYPNCDLGVCTSTGRLAINHRNIPNMIARLSRVLGEEGINITVFSNKCRGEYAYSLIDTDTEIPEDAVTDIMKIPGVLKVRIIK
ncbi:MAG: phosphoglycerate dehydrogenase [Lachnospiraceae bacterium]|nr:phosphoglycerate dehydrogenase [Lachnospiraceae bacterium]